METTVDELERKLDVLLEELENLHARLDATEALLREAEEHNRRILKLP